MTAGREAKSGRLCHIQTEWTGWIWYRTQARVWSGNKPGLEPISEWSRQKQRSGDKPSSESGQNKMGQQLKSGYRITGSHDTQEAEDKAALILSTGPL